MQREKSVKKKKSNNRSKSCEIKSNNLKYAKLGS